MAMITWAKKKFKQIYQYRAKGTYFGYMRDLKKIKKQEIGDSSWHALPNLPKLADILA